MVTIGRKYVFCDSAAAPSRRVISSSVRKRSRPSGSFPSRILGTFLEVAPLLGQPQEMAHERQLAVERGGGKRRAARRHLGQPVALVLRDALRRDVDDRRFLAEPGLKPRQDELVVVNRALALGALERDVFLRDGGEGLGWRWLRWRLRRVELQGASGKCLLCVVAGSPLGVTAALLLAVHLERVAPGDAADATACRIATRPRSFEEAAHGDLLCCERGERWRRSAARHARAPRVAR
jgi:hypothetical protein